MFRYCLLLGIAIAVLNLMVPSMQKFMDKTALPNSQIAGLGNVCSQLNK